MCFFKSTLCEHWGRLNGTTANAIVFSRAAKSDCTSNTKLESVTLTRLQHTSAKRTPQETQHEQKERKASLPDNRRKLRSNEDEETDSDELSGSEQDVFPVT